MMEIRSAQDLVDSLLNTGDKLVIVDFYSLACGGCKSLHPKVMNIYTNVFQNLAEVKRLCHDNSIDEK